MPADDAALCSILQAVADDMVDRYSFACLELSGDFHGIPWRVTMAEDEWADAAEWLGTFTDNDGPDTVPNPSSYGRYATYGAYARFRPAYTLEERYRGARRAGMTRDRARAAALEGAERDAAMAAEYSAVVITVDIGDGLALESLGDVTTVDVPGLPYVLQDRATRYAVLEAVADTAANALWQYRAPAPGQLELIAV
jgi:hypothetical protein